MSCDVVKETFHLMHHHIDYHRKYPQRRLESAIFLKVVQHSEVIHRQRRSHLYCISRDNRLDATYQSRYFAPYHLQYYDPQTKVKKPNWHDKMTANDYMKT